MYRIHLRLGLALVCVFFSVSSAVCQAPPPRSFAAARSFDTPPYPAAVAAADFNGDGKMDLAIASQQATGIYDSLSVLFGNGDGTFQAAVSYTLGLGTPTGIAVGDFNHDGKPDVAVTSGGGVDVLINQGDGTFLPPTNYGVCNPTGVAAGQFTNTGPDLAVASYCEVGLTMLYNNGNGTFSIKSYSATGGDYAVSVAIGDFNRDGLLDVAEVASVTQPKRSGRVVVWPGLGGDLGKPQIYNFGYDLRSVAVGDFNGDNNLDLAVADYGNGQDAGNVSVLLGNGAGTFGSPVNYAAGTNPIAVVAGDFSGDGKTDLAVVNAGSGDVSILVQQPGGFQTALNYASGINPCSVVVADLNADGKPDLAVVNNYGNNVTILLGNGDGTFRAVKRFDAGTSPGAIVSGDFNRDGTVDLAVTNAPNSGSDGLSVLLGNGNGTFQTPAFFAMGTSLGLNSVATADLFDKDGKLDLVVTDYSNSAVYTLLGNGDGTFKQGPAQGAQYPCCAVLADIDGDGRPDLAFIDGPTSSGSQYVTVLYGDGPETWGSSQNLDAGVNPTAIAVGDFNGDGCPDLAVTDYGDYISENGEGVTILLANCSGGFRALTIPSPTGIRPLFVAAGDFNGDGIQDLALASNSENGTDNVSVLLGNGDGTFHPAAQYTVGLYPDFVVVGDFNQDGIADLAVVDGGGATVSFLLGKGDGTFHPPEKYVAGASPGPLSVADFDGDGWPDVAVTDINSNTVAVMMNIAATGIPIVSLSATHLDFPNQLVGTTSDAITLTLTNSGTAQLDISGIAVTGSNDGDFAQSNECGGSVAAGEKCNIRVTFSPTATGLRTAAVTITDNAGDSPQSVALSGTGIAPVAGVSPASLTFGSQDTGTTSPPQPVTLSNTGTASLTVANIVPSGDFGETNNCGSTVAAGGSCTINVTFTPTGTGMRNGTLTITDNSNGVNGSQQTVSITGTGINPGGSVSPISLPFGNQVINTPSAARKLTVTSTGTTNLMNISIAIAGANAADFAQTNNCPSSMAPGAKCTINVTFTPSILGTESATLNVNDNAGNSPQTVALSGAGVPPVTLMPTSANFGNVGINTPSNPKNFTVKNNQSVTLNISSIGITGANAADFSRTGCGGSLAAKTSCTISVTFTPSTLGSESATLTVNEDAPAPYNTLSSSLGGTGVADVTLTPDSAGFGNVAIDTASTAKNFTLKNNQLTALSNPSISFTGANAGDFSQTDTCGGSLAGRSSCTISVTFTPSILGAGSATLTVSDNAPAPYNMLTSSLTGTGVVQATVSPTSLTFAKQTVGTTSVPKTVTLKNNLLTALSISGFTFAGADPGDYAVSSNTCDGSVAAKSSCTISVTFTPSAIGTRTASLNVNDGANNSPQTVSLTGTGK